MSNELDEILKRIDSRLLSKLWSFYRDFFSDDASCIQFIYNCVRAEPIIQRRAFNEDVEKPGIIVLENGETFRDEVFIPRRMLNAVVRLVMAARDMDQIRRGKDIFKIVFIVTCAETLQQLSGKSGQKKELLFSFLIDYVSAEDKEYIAQRFYHEDEDSKIGDENSFQHFVGVINEYRNCAAHEGDYSNYCFNNDSNKDEWPLSFTIRIDLLNYSSKNKKEHRFCTQLSYKEFERIFIRTCISFIKQYVKEKSSACPNNDL